MCVLNSPPCKNNEKYSTFNKGLKNVLSIIDKTTGENTLTISHKNKSDFHTIKKEKTTEEKAEITGPEDLHFANVVNMQNNKLISKQFERNNTFDEITHK